MKTLKKFLAVALALALCALCALPALATDAPVVGGEVDPNATYDLNLTNPQTGHTYVIYQLFKGVPAMEGEDWVLSNVEYGTSGWTDGDKKAAEAAEKISEYSVADLDAFVAGLNYGDDGLTAYAESEKTAEDGSALTWNVPGGYYIIRDITEKTGENADEALSAIMVTVVGSVDIKTKTTTTTSEKKVDASTGEGADPDWQDAAQKEVGKEFKFKLTANVSASDLDKYTTVVNNKGGFYKLVFNDTMSAGLDFVKFDTFRVLKSDGATATGVNVKNSDIDTVKVEDNKFSVTIPNLFDTIGTDKDAWGEYKNTDGNIVVELIYTAKLNSNAIVYPELVDGKPNWNSFNVSFSRDPSSFDENELGETPDDEVFVYTFKIDATKVAGDNNNAPLAGAGFKLYKVDGDKVTEDGVVAEDATAMKFKLGTEEPNAGKYVVSNDQDAKEEVFSAEDVGTFNFAGLEAGKYVLVETTTPAGYNTMANMVITITATKDENDTKVITMSQTATQGESTVEGSTGEDGQPHFNVVNNKGSLLPSTGGIGTTIFYVVGGALVVGAGVLLFTKKRIGSKG